MQRDLQNEDGDVDRMVAAVEAIDREATTEWLPTLHKWLATKGDFFLREAAAQPIARLEGIASLNSLIAAHILGSAENHDNDTLVERNNGDWARLIDILGLRSPQSVQPLLAFGGQRTLLRQAAIAMRQRAQDALRGDLEVFRAAAAHRETTHWPPEPNLA